MGEAASAEHKLGKTVFPHMSALRNFIFYTIILISTVIVLASLLSLIPDLTYWYSKVLDFPRPQYLIISLLCLLVFCALNKKWRFSAISLTLGLMATILIQALYILPYYTGNKAVPDAEELAVNKENTVSIMIANVLITNKAADDLKKIIAQAKPDLLLVMEVNQWWIDQLSPLEKEYAHVIKYPADNAYGMALYSKLPLENTKTMFLKHKNVPSIHSKVVLPSGREFMFHGVHPVAPVPSDQYPDNQGENEIALLLVGEMVAKNPLPAIVAGDYNDVSWSNTSRLFEGAGNLNNVRLGRGLFNTYNSKSFIQRWPLDHYFVTQDFALLKLKRLPAFDSDHFPMFASFVLQ